MFLDQSFPEARSAGIDQPVLLSLLRSVPFSSALLEQLGGQCKLTRENSTVLSCWTDRGTLLLALKSLLPATEFDMGPLEPPMFHMLRIRGNQCLEVLTLYARKSESGQGISALSPRFYPIGA
jgi:hypothetical protein